MNEPSGPVVPNPPTYNPQMSGPRTSGAAIAALVLGILCFICFGPLAAIPAIICGIVALNNISKSGGALQGKGMAIAGLVMGIVGVLLVPMMAAILLPALARAREAARRASCANNLKQFGVIFKMYANENREEWPPLAEESGRLMMEPNLVYPDYLTDPSILRCPSDPDPGPSSPDFSTKEGAFQSIDDDSYFYFGYAVTNDTEAKALAEAYCRAMKGRAPLGEEIEVQFGSGTGGGDTLYRLREDVPRHLSTDGPKEARSVQGSIPVMMDRRDNHPMGGNVLFMDGHVEFIRYGAWPMTEATLEALESMDSAR